MRKINLMTTLRLFLLLSLLSVFACNADKKTDATAADTTEMTEPVTLDPKDLPRPTGCVFLTDQQILDVLKPETEANINVQAGPSVSSCYYRVDSRYWSADLIIEVADGSRADALLVEVKDAPAAEKATVNGHPARIMNDNRIMKVNTGPPYEIKLSILAKEGYKEVKSSDDRKAIMLELAKLLEEKI